MIYGLLDSKSINRSYIYSVSSIGTEENAEKVQPEFPKISFKSSVLSEINFEKSEHSCEKFFYLRDLRKSLFFCKDKNSKWYILMRCGDHSCNDQIENLKICDNKNDKTANIHMKILPAINNSSTLVMYIWFEQDFLLEEVSIDLQGQYSSKMHVLDKKLRNIRYFAGQLLIFEFIEPGFDSIYYQFADSQVGFDMKSLRRMAEMGFFVNSFSSREFADLIIESFNKRSDIISSKYNRQINEFTIETTMETFFPKDFTPVRVNGRLYLTYIFEMNQYKLMVSARATEEDNFDNVSYYLIFKGKVLKTYDF